MKRPMVAGITLALLIVPLVATSTAAAKPKCDGKVATKVGTKGNDVIFGTNGADVIVAKGGRDKIWGKGGNDRICAGAGNDIVKAGSGKDRVFGGSGNDTIEGQSKNDRLYGGSGLDSVKGGPGHDLVKGDGGSDMVFGGDGIDVVKGGSGPDMVYGGTGNDRLYGNDGIDELRGDPGTDVLDGGPDTDRCTNDFVDKHVNCETADLSAKVDGPDSATAGELIEYVVEVKNGGPTASTYLLTLDYSTFGAASCSPDGPWDRTERTGPIAPTTDEKFFVGLTCTGGGGGALARVHAYVEADGTDPVTGNDSHSFAVPLLAP